MNDPHEYDNWRPDSGLDKNSIQVCKYCKAVVLYYDLPDHYDWHRRLRKALEVQNAVH